MEKEQIRELLQQYRQGNIEENEILERIRLLPYEEIKDFAMIDHHRSLRQGFPEVIFCPGKTVSQICEIIKAMNKSGSDILATRADEKIYKAVKKYLPDAEYHKTSRAITVKKKNKQLQGCIAVISAGTSDIPVAEEAKITAELMGSKIETLYDVGVAGIHRFLKKMDILERANVVIVIAGMDGALASVVGGLANQPVIAVPTSIGYGASFGGIAPLLTMLNTCAVGVAVVNIDNGFGAGIIAHRINIQAGKRTEKKNH